MASLPSGPQTCHLLLTALTPAGSDMPGAVRPTGLAAIQGRPGPGQCKGSRRGPGGWYCLGDGRMGSQGTLKVATPSPHTVFGMGCCILWCSVPDLLRISPFRSSPLPPFCPALVVFLPETVLASWPLLSPPSPVLSLSLQHM